MVSHERDLHVVQLDAVVTLVALFVSRTPIRLFSGRFSLCAIVANMGPILVAAASSASASVE